MTSIELPARLSLRQSSHWGSSIALLAVLLVFAAPLVLAAIFVASSNRHAAGIALLVWAVMAVAWYLVLLVGTVVRARRRRARSRQDASPY